MIAVQVAKYLMSRDLVTYSEGTDGDCFVDKMPQAPDVAVVINTTGGFREDIRLGYDSPTIQVISRGTPDPTVAYDRLRAIYNVLHGLRGMSFDDGTYLVGCFALQSEPIRLGPDQNQRQEYSMNFMLHVRSLTEHRE